MNLFAWGGATLREVAGFGSLIEFCTQREVGSGGIHSVDWEVSSDLSAFYSPEEEQAVRILFSNTLPMQIDAMQAYYDASGGWIHDPAYATEWNEAAAISHALQLVLWEILDETSGTYDLGSGHHSYTLTPGRLAHDYAQTWTANLNSGAWSDLGGIELHYANPTNGRQDLLWVGAVPEPSALVLSAMGMVAIATRRRRA